jgi:hypothetical protein
MGFKLLTGYPETLKVGFILHSMREYALPPRIWRWMSWVAYLGPKGEA